MKSEETRQTKNKLTFFKNLPKLVKIPLIILVSLVILVAALYLGNYIYCNTIAICDRFPTNQSPEFVATITIGQYQAALQDIDSGNYDMASKRLEYITSIYPKHPLAQQKLNEIQLLITPTPAQTPIPTPTPIYLTYNSDRGFLTDLPNLLTNISPEKITLFPRQGLNDYVIDNKGGLWAVGGFGVLHHDINGEETWYNLKNGLLQQHFTSIAISPSGEVWIGGPENALFRFDGEQWIDEGKRLPPPYDNREGWLCYSKNISGIDFGPDGETWVMNNGVEIYHQINGQWVNLPFPKELLPWAGGGGCPEGIRVESSDDIIIKFSPC